MEVILREDVDKVGARGALVKVAAGYARNFLLPRKLAVRPPSPIAKSSNRNAKLMFAAKRKPKTEAQDLAKLLTGVTLTFRHKVGENDHLFGSVTAKDIAEAFGSSAFPHRTPQGSTRRANPHFG